jgi:predicted GIY-YIG superfamily endonuclease
LRCVYVYEFRDKYAYIGLILNIENRDKNHRKIKSPVGSYKTYSQNFRNKNNE